MRKMDKQNRRLLINLLRAEWERALLTVPDTFDFSSKQPDFVLEIKVSGEKFHNRILQGEKVELEQLLASAEEREDDLAENLKESRAHRYDTEGRLTAARAKIRSQYATIQASDLLQQAAVREATKHAGACRIYPSQYRPKVHQRVRRRSH